MALRGLAPRDVATPASLPPDLRRCYQPRVRARIAPVRTAFAGFIRLLRHCLQPDRPAYHARIRLTHTYALRTY